MSKAQIVERFQAHLAALPAEDHEPQWVIGHIVDFFTIDSKELVAELGGKEAAAAAAVELYEKYLAPYDLPYVPNLIVEPALDKAIARLLGSLVYRALDKLDG